MRLATPSSCNFWLNVNKISFRKRAKPYLGACFVYLGVKKKALGIVSVIFFLLVHSMGLWEGYSRLFSFVALPLFALTYLILTLLLLREIINAIYLKFASKRQNITIILLLAVLGLTAWRPFGIINFSSFEAKAVLIAQREGVASCTETLYLKENGRFRHRSVCFGIQENTGDYTLANDTVYFSNARGWRFSYGVIHRCTNGGTTPTNCLSLYQSTSDKEPFILPVTLMEIP